MPLHPNPNPNPNACILPYTMILMCCNLTSLRIVHIECGQNKFDLVNNALAREQSRNSALSTSQGVDHAGDELDSDDDEEIGMKRNEYLSSYMYIYILYDMIYIYIYIYIDVCMYVCMYSQSLTSTSISTAYSFFQ